MRLSTYIFLAAGGLGAMATVACSSSSGGGSGGSGATTTTTTDTTGGSGTGGTGTGTKACNDLLDGDPASASWSMSDSASDFTTAGGAAYDALQKCACEDSTPTGCKDVCTKGINGTTTPNFCDSGKTPNQTMAATSCYGCLMMTCGSQVADCKAN